MTMVKWRLYYGDNTVYDDLMGEPEDAPNFDVQVIACYEKGSGRQLYYNFDWYYFKVWDDGLGEWFGADIYGLLDQLLTYPRQIKCIKQGRSVRNEVFREILKRAINDKDIPLDGDNVREVTPNVSQGRNDKG
jgi:hypothetical protein